jgi:hypothetical protein
LVTDDKKFDKNFASDKRASKIVIENHIVSSKKSRVLIFSQTPLETQNRKNQIFARRMP